jgi:hypothetical protein
VVLLVAAFPSLGRFFLAETTAPEVLRHEITAKQGDANFMRKYPFSINVIVIYRDFADPLLWVDGLEFIEDAMIDVGTACLLGNPAEEPHCKVACDACDWLMYLLWLWLPWVSS